MSTENEQKAKMALEMKPFRISLDKVRLTNGMKLELAASARNSVSGFARLYSHLYPLENEITLNNRLTSFINELVPEGEDQKSLEDAFEKNPDKITRKSRCNVISSEWQTIHKNVAIGVRAVRDERGENFRIWYLRNTARDRR